MPRTIDEGFRDFLAKLTPSGQETAAAKSHRASIEACIANNFGLKRFWRTGSFGNGTSIRGYSDVDYMACIPTEALKSNSSTSLANLTSALSSRFPNTGVRTSCPATLVPFGASVSENTEVTPADYVGTEGDFKVYDIPDCEDGWTKASPDAHNHYVRECDRQHSGRAKALIRLLKAWKYFQNVPVFSFYLELRVAKYAAKENSILYPIDLKRVFALLADVELARVLDPMGVSGYIQPCATSTQLDTAKSKVATALTRATKAYEAKSDGDIKSAFLWWDKLFGGKFPPYYK